MTLDVRKRACKLVFREKKGTKKITRAINITTARCRLTKKFRRIVETRGGKGKQTYACVYGQNPNPTLQCQHIYMTYTRHVIQSYFIYKSVRKKL